MKTENDLVEEYIGLLLRKHSAKDAADVLIEHAIRRETKAKRHADFAAMLRARAQKLSPSQPAVGSEL